MYSQYSALKFRLAVIVGQMKYEHNLHIQLVRAHYHISMVPQHN